MDPQFLAKLNVGRGKCPFPWEIGRGGGDRTKEYNAGIKGAPIAGT